MTSVAQPNKRVNDLRKISELFGRTEAQAAEDIKQHGTVSEKVVEEVRQELEEGKQNRWRRATKKG